MEDMLLAAIGGLRARVRLSTAKGLSMRHREGPNIRHRNRLTMRHRKQLNRWYLAERLHRVLCRPYKLSRRSESESLLLLSLFNLLLLLGRVHKKK